MSNRDEIEKALSYIEPHDRDVWVNTAYSLKHELGEEAFDMWDRWSQQSDSYSSRDARSVWVMSAMHDARSHVVVSRALQLQVASLGRCGAIHSGGRPVGGLVRSEGVV